MSHRDTCGPAARTTNCRNPTDDDDPALSEYNAYLADLAKEDKERPTT